MRNEPSRVAGSGAAFIRAINRASRRQAASPPLPTQESLPLHTASPCFGKSLLSTVIPLSQPGCVRFKSLEDLALDVVGRTVARVSAEEHMANYQAARAFIGKGRNAGEGAAGLSKSSAKKGARKSPVKNGAKGMSDMAGKAAR